MPRLALLSFARPAVTNPFLEQIRRHVRHADYRPATKSELARQLGVRADDRSAFRQALRTLEQSGELVCGKRSRYSRREPGQDGGKAAEQRITGKIFFPPNETRRHGFFRPDPESAARPELRGLERDIFVPGRFAATAMQGDRVAVKLAKKPAPRWQRHVKGRSPRGQQDESAIEAHVVEILERGFPRIVGTFRQHGRYAHLVPDHPSLPTTFNLMGPLLGAKNGDKVVGRLELWDSPLVPPIGVLLEVLGRPEDPGVDILSVIHRYGLPTHFPEAVLAEADAIPEMIDPEEIGRREDWRDREVFTIDPEDARDFDDAICVHEFEAAEGGGWELAVHIADVSHFVRTGSALDREAKKRGNSVYLADRVLPMLPEKLSNGVCSLKAGVDRLTHAVIMRFNADARQTSARFVPAVIRSRRRYSYEEAFARLNLTHGEIDRLEPGEAALGHHLKRAWELARRLRERRFRSGALELDFPEVRAVVDERGRAIGVKRSDYDESHQLIEEFMLAANEAVAYETKNALAPSLYRVHEDPDPDKLMEFGEQARGYGHAVGDVTLRPELQKLLAAIRGRSEEHSLKIALLKSLKRAAYSPEPMGHYGLAKLNYTHFTSPIRRYADLVVHRVLRWLVIGRNPVAPVEAVDATPAQGRLGEIAKHISETERIAADAEQETQRMKLLEYLLSLTTDDRARTFEGIVYDVRPIGAFVELTDLMIKGLIRKDDLPTGQGLRFDAARNRFAGFQGKTLLAVGQKVNVRVARVDRARGFIDFLLDR
jgi:ribonuclease R